MNVVDIIILIILGIGLLTGLYRGFIHSVLNLGSGLLSFVASFFLYPKLADVVSGNPEIIRMISSFTDSESLLGDLDLSNKLVSALNPQNISAIVEKADLPEPIGTLSDGKAVVACGEEVYVLSLPQGYTLERR